MPQQKIAALISGRGSNLQAIIDACKSPDFPAELALVISNTPDVYGLERAEKAGIKNIVIDHRDFETRDDFEDAMNSELNESNISLICLAGFMRLLNTKFVNSWRDRIINIHPALLPSFKGLHTHERAIEVGARFHGCTVHFVRPEMDDGPIILQASVPISSDDTPKTLAKKVLEQEHIIYPEAIRLITSGQARVVGDKVHIQDENWEEKSLINPIPK